MNQARYICITGASSGLGEALALHYAKQGDHLALLARRYDRLESLKGKLLQAGLPPNPTAGINGEDINEDGGAGRYGIYFGREVVRGNKLELSRSVVCAEIDAAERRLAEVRQRLLTDIRQRYYDVLIAQETVATAAELVSVADEAAEVSNQLLEAGEVAQTSLLQARIELQNARVVRRQAENELLAARRKLAGLLGESDLSIDVVPGSSGNLLEPGGFEETYDELLNNSPELAALFAEVEQKWRRVRREAAEPIPNLTWQTTIQYDMVGDDVIAGFQLGMPIPTLNRNQGAVCQARQQAIAAQRKAEKRALALRQELTTAYEAYLDARLAVDAYETEIIPQAEETLELVRRGYRDGETDFLQYLTAQRSYSEFKLDYLRQLNQVCRQSIAIRGLLLSGGLN